MLLNAVLVVSITYTIYSFEKFENSLLDLNDKCICIGKILSFEKEGKNYYKYVFIINEVILEDKTYIKVDNVRVYLYLNEKYEYGDILTCRLKFEIPIPNTNVGGFNQKMFMYSNGLSGYAYLKDIINVKKNKNGILYYINRIKYNMCNTINSSFDTDTANIIKTMLLNDDSSIDKVTKDIFYDIGISHILVPSSTHLMYILILITYIISMLGIKLKYKNIFSFLTMLFYLFLTNFAVSVIRVCLMFSLMLILNMSNVKNVKKIDILCIALVCMLLVNPLMIYNIGLLLSFGSVLGIMLFTNKIKHKLQFGLNKKNNKLLSRVIELLGITLAVQVIIIPILMNTFNTLYIISLLANILVVPLSGLLIIFSIFFSALYNIPFIKDILIFICTFDVIIITNICKFFKEIPLSKTNVLQLNIFEMVIYYVGVYLLFFSRKYWYKVKEIYLDIFKNNFKLVIGIIIVIIIFFCIYLYYDFILLKVNFVDVGQGDCTLIQVYGKSILIDGGGSKSSDFDIGQRILMPYLLYKRVLQIDYIFISHFDYDHFQGIYSIIENFNVKNIVISKQYIFTDEFVHFIEKVNDKNINIIIVEKGDYIHIGENAYFQIIFPDNIYDIKSVNNNSVVMKFTYYNLSILFTGDVEQDVEMYLINKYPNMLNSSILKVGHHGAKTSTTKEFLDAISPNIALIGVGRGNSFGHPNNQVIDRLKNASVNVYRTDINGEIDIYKFMNGNINVKTVM